MSRKKRKKDNKDFIAKIALERIWRLFELAEKEFSKHPGRSKRYVALARKISTRNKATIPAELKRKFCKKCGAYLKKGKNSEWKHSGSFLVIKCRECNAQRKTKP